ncbi:AAA family ATPase [Paraburkholderia sp. SIMBA_054]|uniref:AAA family ATPase n=1 Tax=Paraburkholderia sp. SIMBA_054 TaxID=3085795 RepID=UPI00397B7F21
MSSPSIAAESAQPTLPNPDVRAARKLAATSALSMLPDFVDRHRWGNRTGVDEVLEKMALALADSHPAIAAKLTRHRSLKPVQVSMPTDILSFEEPPTRFRDVILPQQIEEQLPAILEEHARADDLSKFGLTPRHKILLDGPPGNGKTLLAQAFAGELGVPLLRVNYSGLIGGTLGATGGNLAKVFAYAECGPAVLFLDEFDSVATARETSDLGELRRITNQLLILMDRLPSHCVLICATNLRSLIDSAVLRRFDFQITIPEPSEETRLLCANVELAEKLTPGINLSHLAPLVAAPASRSLSDIVALCREIRRDVVLNDGRNVESLARQPAAAEAGDLATLIDGWYWIKKKDWGDGYTDWLPALWRAEFRSWASVSFSGIPADEVIIGRRLVYTAT